MDEKYLQDIYNWILSQDATYKNDYSFDAFKSKMQDPTYAKKMHTWMGEADPSSPVKDTPFDAFVTKTQSGGGATVSGTAEELKKKVPSKNLQLLPGQENTTESSSEDGSLALQKPQPKPFNPYDYTPQNRAVSDATYVAKPINKFELEKTRVVAEKNKAETAKLLNAQKIQDVQKQKEEEAQKKAASLGISKLPDFQQKIKGVDDKLIDKEEEEVVTKMNADFGKYGFIFEETGAGDAMIVRSFDGKHTMTIDLDPFTNATEVAESAKLRQFLNAYAQEEFKIENEDFLTKANKAQNLRKVGRRNEDGSESTVKMTSFEQDGKFYAIPTLFPVDPNAYNSGASTWQELPFEKALKVAKERGEVFQFNTDAEAKDFANGSWKDVSTRDVEADKFYKERGLDYITEKKRWDKYKELDDIIDFVEGDYDEGKDELQKTHPELFIKGKLRGDAEQYVEQLKQQRDALEPLVKDYSGWGFSGKSETTRMDWDVELEKRRKQVSAEAIKINNEAKAMAYQLDAQSIEKFGLPAKDLFKYKNTNPDTQADFNRLQQEYYAVQQTQKAAATKFEISKTYFDGKSDKQISGEFKENLAGFWNTTKDSYKNGNVGMQLLSFSMPGGKDVSSFEDKAEAAKYIASQYAEMSGTEDRAMARWRNARGFGEWMSTLADDPVEIISTFVASSISQILPYGWKLVAASTVTGAGVGAAYGAAGGAALTPEFLGAGAAPGAVGGAIGGGIWGFRGGMAMTSLASEYVNAVMAAVENNGYNPMDPESLAQALGDQRVWDEGRNTGLTRGIPIAVADLLSAGLAGRVFKPASAMASTGRRVATGVAERLVFDPLAEGAGELAAQGAEIVVGTGRKDIGWKEIAEESIGGLGNNTINWGMNTYKDIKNRSDIDIAQTLTQIGSLSAEKASDEKITTWANNMLQLKKIDADVAQRINENVGLRRDAKELLGVGTGKKANTDVLNRTMELLSAKKELSSTQNRREIYRSKIAAINEEIATIGETKSLLPTDKAVDLNSIIEAKSKGTSQYSIDGRRFTKEQFIQKVNSLPDEQLSRITLGIKNDPETGKLIKSRYDAIQKSETGTGVLRTEESEMGLQGVGTENGLQTTETGAQETITNAESKILSTVEETLGALNTLPTEEKTNLTFTNEKGEQVPLNTNEKVAAELYHAAIATPEEERTPAQQSAVDAIEVSLKTVLDAEIAQPQINEEIAKLESLIGTPSGEPKFRVSDGSAGSSAATNSETITTEMNNMPAAQVGFTEPSVSQKGLKVNPVQESNSLRKVAKKVGDALMKPIQYFNGIPMIMGMSDMLAAGQIKDSEGNSMDVDGGLLFNVLGKNKEAAWAGVSQEGAQAQYDNAVELYEKNKELFDKLWKEGKLPDGHIPMAIMRMADTAVNSNEATFRWALPTIESFSQENREGAMTAFIGSMKEKLNTKEEAAKAEKVLDFINDNKINSLDQFFKAIVADANQRAKNPTQAKLALDDRTMIYDAIFAPSGIKTASKPTIKALLQGSDGSKNKTFTSDAVYAAIGEPSMLKTKQGEVVSVVGIDVKNGGVIAVEHGNYGFGPKGKTIALIENPTHGIDVFAEWKAKASRVFKENKQGKLPNEQNVANQTGGTFFTDKAFKGAKVAAGVITDLNLLLGKLKYAFPSVTVSTNLEEFNTIINSPEARKMMSSGNKILGVVKDGKIYLNPEMESLQTPIHEFGHIWVDFLRSDASGKKGTELLNRGLKLVKNTEAHKAAIEKYGNTELALEEALVELMANKGATIIDAAQKSEFKSWMNAVFKYIQEKFTTFKDLDSKKIAKMKLEDFINTGLADLFSGKEVSAKFAPELSESSFNARMSAVTDIQKIVKVGRANGISEAAITKLLKDKGFNDSDITKAFEKDIAAAGSVTLSEDVLAGYDRMMQEAEAIVADKKRGRKESEMYDAVMGYVQGSLAYENATDVQREQLFRDVRKRFGLKEKSAPNVGRILGTIQNLKMITMAERDFLKKQLKDYERGAKNAKSAWIKASTDLTKAVKDMATSGKLTVKQVANVLRRFSSVNMFNEDSIDKFVDYMANVFEDAEYADKINTVRNQLPTARKNVRTKLGAAMNLIPSMERLFSINPNLIPMHVLNPYMSLVDMMGKRQETLDLKDIEVVTRLTNAILDMVDEEQSQAEELADRLEWYSNPVLDDDGNLKYAETVAAMVKDGTITEEEAALMRKYKSIILPRPEKAEMTEQEIAAEKKALVDTLDTMNIDASKMASFDDRAKANNLKVLLKTAAVNRLSAQQLKNLIKVVNAINNGYFPHSAQLVIERLNAINNAISLNEAIQDSKLLGLTKFYSKMKSMFTGKDPVQEMVRRGPLYFVDQLFGDFKTKRVFNAIFNEAAKGQALFESNINKINKQLDQAHNDVAKSFGMNPNKTVMSSYKMMAYMIQQEFLSNPDSNQVNPAHKFLEATIKHLDNDNRTDEADMLQDILDNYTDTNGVVDAQELYDSFNSAEKSALKLMREINDGLTEKAVHTAGVVRGQKISPLNNYIHLPVMTDLDAESTTSATAAADAYNRALMPSTKGKSLIERTGTVNPLNFDVFAAVQQGAKSVLMDYHLTEPIRTARKTLAETEKMMSENGRPTKEQRQVFSAIKKAFNEATENLLINNYVSSTFADDVANYMTKQGYRAILASVPRFMAELTSNIGFAMVSDRKAFMTGVKLTDVLLSPKAVDIVNNVKSKQINRLFHGDALSGRFIDTSILSNKSGIKGAKPKGAVRNIAEMVYNRSLKKYKNAVELTADTLISTPDKMVMRPIWFGSFANKFEAITGTKIDFDKIAANDESYMEQYKSAITEATTFADDKSVLAGATDNAYMGILKGTSKPNQSGLLKAFNNFNNFMTRFAIYEYTAARTGIYAMVGNGTITKKQGAALIAGVTTRMVVYTMLVQSLGTLMMSMFSDAPADDEEDEKSFGQKLGQALTSAGTGLLLGRDFGNATRGLVNYGVEGMNEKFLTGLRKGEYDPYKDAIAYSIMPKEKKGHKTNLSDFLTVMGGSMGPSLKTLDLMVRKATEEPKKELGAIKRQQDEIETRIPLEVLGNLGYIPLYKDVRKVVVNNIYSSLKEEEKTKKINKEQKEAEDVIKDASDLDILNKLRADEYDPKKKRIIEQKINQIANESPEEKDARKEANRLMKERKKVLLGEYDNQSDMKRYDRAKWDKTFGPNSEWGKQHQLENEIDNALDEERQKIEDDMHNYTPKGGLFGNPSKKSKKNQGLFGGSSKGGGLFGTSSSKTKEQGSGEYETTGRRSWSSEKTNR